MNLQEHIRKVLREELSTKVRRRISPEDMEMEFLESFGDAYKSVKRRRVGTTFFLDELVYTTIVYMMDRFDGIFSTTLSEDEFWYDNIFNELKEFYETRIMVMGRKKLGINESILREVRVPRNERIELYKDSNIIVVVPLTHRALQKYSHQCQWCINDDESEWSGYHQGKHAVIIQRNPKKPKIGITNHPTPSEIFFITKWDNNQSSFEDICQILDYEFRSDRTMGGYYNDISNNINNFATNIVYYSPKNGIYDQEDNFLWNFNFEISDIPNVTPEVIKIMDDYLVDNFYSASVPFKL